MGTTRSGLGAALVGLVLATNAGAQELPVGTRSCGMRGTSVIVATVVDDSTRRPVAGSWISLLEAVCSGVADSVGRFLFTDLANGGHSLETGQIDYREFGRLPVYVVTGDTLEVELRLRPGGPIQDCRVVPACAPLLADAPSELPEADRFQLLTLGTAIALGWQRQFAQRAPPYVCMEGLPAALLAALTSRYRYAVDRRECEIPSGRSFDPIRHIETGSPGLRVSARVLREPDATHREVVLEVRASPSGGESWICRYERAETVWRIGSCQLYGQS